MKRTEKKQDMAIGITSFRNYTEFLTDGDIYKFDTMPDGELQPLDFKGKDELWQEFTSRYVQSPKPVRDKFAAKMSNALKIKLCYDLFQLWNGDGASKDEKSTISESVRRDFFITFVPEMTREKIVNTLMQPQYYVGEEIDVDFINDPVRGNSGTYLSFNTYGGASAPIRLSSERFLLEPYVNLLGTYNGGNRTLKSKGNEDIGYLLGNVCGGLGFSDFKDENYYFGGSGCYTARTHVPDGYPVSNYSWKGYAGLKHPKDLPFAITVSGGGSANQYAEAAEADQNRNSRKQFYFDSALTWNVDASSALLGGYEYYFADNVYNYSSWKDLSHLGFLKYRYRKLSSVVDTTVTAESEEVTDGVRKGNEFTKEKSNRVNLKLSQRFFTFLGKGVKKASSIDASGFLKFSHSSGDLDANFGGYGFSLSGNVFVVQKLMEMALGGKMSHDLIYQDKHDYQLSYNGSLGINFYISRYLWNNDKLTLSPSVSGSQTVYRGTLDYKETSVSGGLDIVSSFDVMKGLELLFGVSYGRDWDSKQNYDSRDLSFRFYVTANF